jgi:PAS domain S-box-containing protein
LLPTSPNQDSAPGADVRGWRAPVLETSLRITAVLGSFWIFVVLATASDLLATVEAKVAIALLVPVWIATLAKSLSETVRLACLLAFDLGIAFVGMRVNGPSPGPVLLMLLAVLKSTLFFGARGGLAAAAVVLTTYGLVAHGYVHGRLPIMPNLLGRDPAALRYWLRPALAQLLGSGAVVAIVVYVLGYANDALRRLKESEEKFSQAFRGSPEALTISELETSRFLDVSQGFERWFGWKREELIGRPAVELDMWADVSQRDQMLAELRQHGTVRDFRATARKRDGSLSACMVAIEQVQIGGRACLLAVLRDVTNAVRAEMALRESEEKFSKAFRASPDAVVISEFETGRYLEVNDSHERLTGYTREQVLGKDAIELGVYRDQEQRKERLAELSRSGKISDLELYLTRTDGNIAIARCNVELIELGGRKCLITVLRDVTDRVHAEQALRESEEKFSKAFHVSPNAITITEIESARFVDVNEGYTKLFGFTREEVLGRTALEVGMWQDPIERAQLMAELREKGSVRDHAVHVKNRAGHEFTMLFSSDRIELGGKPHYVTVGQDITERVEAEKALRASEEQLRRLNAELERRVADRTAQLTAANAELESFSYSVSHDLRSPLRAIDGFSKALEEDFSEQLGEEARDYLRRVRAGSQRMGQLIDDLLQLSRAARMELRREKVPLSALALEIAELMRERQPLPAVDFQCQEGLSALADPALTRIVLENLLSNAWKYTRKTAAPRVEFGVVPAEDSPRESLFFVRDNGAGFDMRYAAKLFSPFQRLHPTSEFEGTGIGLATVRRIATRHGGRVWAESVVGAGTIVYFTLAGVRE